MAILPKISKRVEIRADGYGYVIVERVWLGWRWPIAEIRASTEFWPREISDVPVPKGVRIPKQPTPTPDESQAVSEMMRSRGWMVLRKFWNYQSMMLMFRCTSPEGNEQDKGSYNGFMLGRLIAHRIENWGEQPGDEELRVVESEFYGNMQRMDSEVGGL